MIPADRVVLHMNPPSEARGLTSDRETTVSLVQEVPVEVSKGAAVSRSWTIVVAGSVSPLIWARLSTELPDKYPGLDIRFDAPAGGASGRVQLVRREGAWPVVVTAEYGRTWRYSSARQFGRDELKLSVRVGFERP